MELIFLGTGSAYPSPHRGASAMILQHIKDGSQWLFDCGEGTQIQVQRDSKSKMGKINKIFITHLHGDHVFGLPGLMSSMGTIDGKIEIVEIYGPLGLKKLLRTVLGLGSEKINFRYCVNEINAFVAKECTDFQSQIPLNATEPVLQGEEDGRVLEPELWEDGTCWRVCRDDRTGSTVWAVPLTHGLPCLGYVVLSDDRTPKLDAQRAIELGVKNGRMMGQLKMGNDVTLESGVVVRATDVLGPTEPGLNVALLGDCSDSDSLVRFMRYRDLQSGSKVPLHYLVHEATLDDSMETQCIEKGHSTPSMAAQTALATSADCLVLTHFSQRYKDLGQGVTEDDPACVEIMSRQIRDAGLFKGKVILARDFIALPLNSRL